MPARDTLLALAIILIWAYNIIVIKIGVAEMPPLLLTALRFSLVAGLLVPFTRATRQQLPWLLLLSFTFGTMHLALLFIGLGYAEAGTGALIVQLGTPFATLLAAIFLKERLGLRRSIGLVISFAGVVVIAGGPTLPTALPLALLVSSAMAWAVSNLIIKLGPPIAPLTMAGWTSLFAIPQVTLASWLFEDNQWHALTHSSWQGWGAVIYSALMSSILAYGAWYWLLQKHTMSRVIPLSLLTPVFAVALGIMLLGDSLDLYKFAGGLLVIGGISILNLRGSKATA